MRAALLFKIMSKIMRGALISPYAAEDKNFIILGDIPIEQALRNSLLYWVTVTFASLYRGLLTRLDRVADLLVNEQLCCSFRRIAAAMQHYREA
jgi:hypothetical protein